MKSAGAVKGPRERASLSSYVNRISAEQRDYLQQSIETFETYVHYIIAAKDGMMSGMVDLAYSEIAYFKADVKNAEKLAHQAIRQAREAEQFQIECRALFFLLRISIHRGDTSIIGDLLQRLDALVGNKSFLRGSTLCDIVTGWFYAQIGQEDRVADWLKNDFEQSDLNSLQYGLEKLVRAKYLLLKRRYHAILALFAVPDAVYGLEAFLFGNLEVGALQAVCMYHVGDKEGAISALEDAYSLSLSNGLDMPFIELGRDMRTLTAAAMKSQSCAIPRQWLEKIRVKASTYAKKLNYVVSASRPEHRDSDQLALTSKERDILIDLCHGLSRTEIAYNHNISINTAKASIQMIYTKLGAQNTADAIRIAATLKIIE
jgi:LuxR family maltose regulon positive regulatory protein